MKMLLEPFQAREWLTHLDPRLRLISALLAIFTLSSMHGLLALSFVAAWVLVFALAAGFTLSQLIKRLLLLELFMLVLTLSLLFTTPGQPLFSVGLPIIKDYPINAEGLQLMASIMLRVGSSVILTLVLLASQTPHQLAQAMSSCGLPNKLCWLFLMTIRYIHVFADEYLKLTESMKVRAFQPQANRHTWNTYAWLVGMLLIRSMKRSETLIQAMRCRGFTNTFVSLHINRWSQDDTWFLLAVLFTLSCWLSLEMML